jgi:hypothetical protein
LSTTRLEDGGGSGGNTGPEIGGLLGDGASDGRALHLTLGVDDDTGVVLEVEENTVPPAPRLSLPDDDGGVDLLTELRLTLLDGCKEVVTDAGSGEPVKAGTNVTDGNDVQVLCTSVVGAVHDSADGECQGNPELLAGDETAAGHFLFW